MVSGLLCISRREVVSALAVLVLFPVLGSAENDWTGGHIIKYKRPVMALGSASGSMLSRDGRIHLIKSVALSNGGSGIPERIPYTGDNCSFYLNSDPNIEACEPDIWLETEKIPNDPSFSSGQQSLSQIDAPQAWDLTTGSESVVVAVVDTGVDYNHPDLISNIWTNPGEVPGNGIDDDGNGYIDDVHGYDFFSSDNDPMDTNGHGTHVAGIIAAAGNNGVGVAGVAWKTKILSVKFLGSQGGGPLSGALMGFDYLTSLVEKGVNIRIVNASWGGAFSSQMLEDAIGELSKAGILFVAAAGNSGLNNDNTPHMPSNASPSPDNVISVAAVDSSGNLASFSNYGYANVDIGAPGVGILSTYMGGSYASLSGTSMAAPHVSGVAALTAAMYPGISVTDLRNVILGSASNGSLPVGTGMIVNALRAAGNDTTFVPVKRSYSLKLRDRFTGKGRLRARRRARAVLDPYPQGVSDLGVVRARIYDQICPGPVGNISISGKTRFTFRVPDIPAGSIEISVTDTTGSSAVASSRVKVSLRRSARINRLRKKRLKSTGGIDRVCLKIARSLRVL